MYKITVAISAIVRSGQPHLQMSLTSVLMSHGQRFLEFSIAEVHSLLQVKTPGWLGPWHNSTLERWQCHASNWIPAAPLKHLGRCLDEQEDAAQVMMTRSAPLHITSCSHRMTDPICGSVEDKRPAKGNIIVDSRRFIAVAIRSSSRHKTRKQTRLAAC